MRELSIFIDESSDAGNVSKFYLVSLVFHEQAFSIESSIARYEQVLRDQMLDRIPFHFNPLLNGNDDYRWKDIYSRKRQLGAFAMFVQHLPIAYRTFYFEKDSFTTPCRLTLQIEKDVSRFLIERLDYLQAFDGIKIYYDGGQSVVTQALHTAISHAISRQATIYRDASPERYRLHQVADYVCGIELTAHKFENGLATRTDIEFFDSGRTFKRNYLKQLRKKQMA